MSSRQTYITRETLVSIVMSGLMNTLMHYALMGGRPVIEFWGKSGALVDLGPTVFMTGLMSSVMPGWLTARRVAAGDIAAVHGRKRLLPGNCVLRAILLALLCTVTVVLLAAFTADFMLLQQVTFTSMLYVKWALTLILPVVVTAIAVLESLSVENSAEVFS